MCAKFDIGFSVAKMTIKCVVYFFIAISPFFVWKNFFWTEFPWCNCIFPSGWFWAPREWALVNHTWPTWAERMWFCTNDNKMLFRRRVHLPCVVPANFCIRISCDTVCIGKRFSWCEQHSCGPPDNWNDYGQCAMCPCAVEDFVCLRVIFCTYDNWMTFRLLLNEKMPDIAFCIAHETFLERFPKQFSLRPALAEWLLSSILTISSFTSIVPAWKFISFLINDTVATDEYLSVLRLVAFAPSSCFCGVLESWNRLMPSVTGNHEFWSDCKFTLLWHLFEQPYRIAAPGGRWEN